MELPTRIQLPILANLLQRGDGTWILKPILPSEAGDGDTWVKPHQAAQILRVSRRIIYRWQGEYLVYRRPCPQRIEFSLQSVLDMKTATNDPEFWDTPNRQKTIKNRVQQAMFTLAASALQKS